MFWSSKKQIPDSWKVMDGDSSLDAIVERSHELPVVLFKHSTRCSISSFAFGKLSEEYGANNEDLELYYLDLIAHRSISNEIASFFDVPHQSPQTILIKNGAVLKTQSHEAVSLEGLKMAL